MSNENTTPINKSALVKAFLRSYFIELTYSIVFFGAAALITHTLTGDRSLAIMCGLVAAFAGAIYRFFNYEN